MSNRFGNKYAISGKRRQGESWAALSRGGNEREKEERVLFIEELSCGESRAIAIRFREDWLF